MKLTIVGCAGSFPGPDSPASSYLIQADDDAGRTWSVLLDLGNGAFGALQRILDPFDLDGVAISHLHPDHFVDMSGLYVFLRYHPEKGLVSTGQGSPMAVRAPSDGRERIGALCDVTDEEDIASTFTIGSWKEGEAWQVGPMTITPFLVEHPIESYALRVTGPAQDGTGTRVLTFSGDTDECPGVIDAAQGADLLLIEAAFVEGRDPVRGIHLTGHRAGQVAAKAQAARVLLTHLPAWTPHEVVLTEARDSYPGAIEVVHQGLTYEL